MKTNEISSISSKIFQLLKSNFGTLILSAGIIATVLGIFSIFGEKDSTVISEDALQKSNKSEKVSFIREDVNTLDSSYLYQELTRISQENDHASGEFKDPTIGTKDKELENSGVSASSTTNEKHLERERNRFNGGKNITEFFSRMGKKSEIHYINPQKDTIIVGAEGTVLQIDGGTFVWENDNDLYNVKKVKLELKELYNVSDLMLTKATTTADGRLLESGGSFYIQATAMDKPLKIRTGASITIAAPAESVDPAMKTFYGDRDSIGFVNWTPVPDAEDQMSAEEAPVYQGGYADFNHYLALVSYYPQKAVRKMIEGSTYVGFKIDKNGETKDVELLQNLTADCGSVAMKIFQNMPRWKAARRNNEPTEMHYQIKVVFKITEEGPQIGCGELEPFDYKRWRGKNINSENLGRLSSAAAQYITNITKLGWINIDQFRNGKRKDARSIRLLANADSENTEVFLIVNKRRSIISTSGFDNKFVLENIDLDWDIEVIGISYNHGIVSIATNNISANQDISELELKFKEVDMQEFSKILLSVDKGIDKSVMPFIPR